jgi:hypothetical protein
MVDETIAFFRSSNLKQFRVFLIISSEIQIHEKYIKVNELRISKLINFSWS